MGHCCEVFLSTVAASHIFAHSSQLYIIHERGFGLVQAWVRQNIMFLRYHSGMGLGDSPCTLLVFPWLGEVVGASLAMG